MDDINHFDYSVFFINLIEIKILIAFFHTQPFALRPGFALHYVHIYDRNVEINFPSPKSE